MLFVLVAMVVKTLDYGMQQVRSHFSTKRRGLVNFLFTTSDQLGTHTGRIIL